MAPGPLPHATLRGFLAWEMGSRPVVMGGGMGAATVTQNPHETPPRLQSEQVGARWG